MDFDAANEFLKRRLTVATTLKSAGISKALDARIRAQCFFSAQVAQGRVVEHLRTLSDAYSRGEIDLATARKHFKDWYDLDSPGARERGGERMGNLGSTMRLNLVFRQNALMAASVGRWQVGRDPAVEERWPCWRYVAGFNPRSAHRFYDGMVFRKSDPVWHRIFPPWEFNCNCDVEDAETPAGGPDHLAPEDIHESADGFRFDPADPFREFDPARIKDEWRRAEVSRQMVERFDCTKGEDGKLHSRPYRSEYGGQQHQASAPQFQMITNADSQNYYDPEHREPKNQHWDPSTGEMREDREAYVKWIRAKAASKEKEEPTTLDAAAIARQRDACRKDHPALCAQAEKAYSQLSEGEKHSLDSYTSRDSYRLNKAALGRWHLDPAQLRERQRIGKALLKLPQFNGTVYRGMGFSQEQFSSFIEQLNNSNDAFTGFVSTTWDEEKAMEYSQGKEVRAVFEIRNSSKGHFIGSASCTPDDKEVLFTEGQKFKITGSPVQDSNGIFHIQLEEV